MLRLLQILALTPRPTVSTIQVGIEVEVFGNLFLDFQPKGLEALFTVLFERYEDP